MSYRKNAIAARPITIIRATPRKAGIMQPIARPILRCLPDFVRGIPSLRDSRPFAADKPDARRHENESPYVFRRRAMGITAPRYLLVTKL